MHVVTAHDTLITPQPKVKVFFNSKFGLALPASHTHFKLGVGRLVVIHRCTHITFHLHPTGGIEKVNRKKPLIWLALASTMVFKAGYKCLCALPLTILNSHRNGHDIVHALPPLKVYSKNGIYFSFQILGEKKNPVSQGSERQAISDQPS